MLKDFRDKIKEFFSNSTSLEVKEIEGSDNEYDVYFTNTKIHIFIEIYEDNTYSMCVFNEDNFNISDIEYFSSLEKLKEAFDHVIISFMEYNASFINFYKLVSK